MQHNAPHAGAQRPRYGASGPAAKRPKFDNNNDDKVEKLGAVVEKLSETVAKAIKSQAFGDKPFSASAPLSSGKQKPKNARHGAGKVKKEKKE